MNFVSYASDHSTKWTSECEVKSYSKLGNNLDIYTDKILVWLISNTKE